MTGKTTLTTGLQSSQGTKRWPLNTVLHCKPGTVLSGPVKVSLPVSPSFTLIICVMLFSKDKEVVFHKLFVRCLKKLGSLFEDAGTSRLQEI